jgi:hypothetical protein
MLWPARANPTFAVRSRGKVRALRSHLLYLRLLSEAPTMDRTTRRRDGKIPSCWWLVRSRPSRERDGRSSCRPSPTLDETDAREHAHVKAQARRIICDRLWPDLSETSEPCGAIRSNSNGTGRSGSYVRRCLVRINAPARLNDMLEGELLEGAERCRERRWRPCCTSRKTGYCCTALEDSRGAEPPGQQRPAVSGLDRLLGMSVRSNGIISWPTSSNCARWPTGFAPI